MSAAVAALLALSAQPCLAQGETPSVVAAAQGGDLPELQRLVASGSEVNARDATGNTALFYAAAGGQTEMVAALLRVGADPSIVGANGWTPSDVASFAGHGRVVEIIGDADRNQTERTAARAPADPFGGEFGQARSTDISEDLRRAAKAGDAGALRASIAQGAAVDAPDGAGRTALSYAAFNGHDAAIAILLDSGAGIDHRDAKGMTPLMAAAAGGWARVAQRLLDAGADRQLKSRDGRMAADIARDLNDARMSGVLSSAAPIGLFTPAASNNAVPPVSAPRTFGAAGPLAAERSHAAARSRLLQIATAAQAAPTIEAPEPRRFTPESGAMSKVAASSEQTQIPAAPAADAPVSGTVVELGGSAAILSGLLDGAPAQAPGPTTLAAAPAAAPAAVVALALRREPEQPFQPIFGNAALGVQATNPAEGAPAKPAVLPPPVLPTAAPQPAAKLKPPPAPLSAGARAPAATPPLPTASPPTTPAPVEALAGAPAATTTRGQAVQWDGGSVLTKPDSLPPKHAVLQPKAVAPRLRPVLSPVIPLPRSSEDLRTAKIEPSVRNASLPPNSAPPNSAPTRPRAQQALAQIALAPSPAAKPLPAPASPLVGPKVDDPAEAGSASAGSVNAEPIANPARVTGSNSVPAPADAASASDVAPVALSPLEPLDLPQPAIALASATDRVATGGVSRATPVPIIAPLPEVAPRPEPDPASTQPKILTPPPRVLAQLRTAALPAQIQESPQKTAPMRLSPVGQPSTRSDLAREGFQFVSDPTVEGLANGSSEAQWTAANLVADGASVVQPLTAATNSDRSALAQAGLAPDPSAAFAAAPPRTKPLGNRLTAQAAQAVETVRQAPAARPAPRRPQIALRGPSPEAETLIHKESSVSDMSFLVGRWSFDCADNWYEFKQIGEARFERFYSKSQSRRIVTVTRQGQLIEAVSRNNNVIVYLKYHVVDRNKMVLLDTTYSEGGDNFFSVQGNLEFTRCG